MATFFKCIDRSLINIDAIASITESEESYTITLVNGKDHSITPTDMEELLKIIQIAKMK